MFIKRDIKKMRVCFFCGDMNNSGGTERVSTIIANKLVKFNDYEIIFLSLCGGDKPFFDLDKEIVSYSLFNKRTSFIKTYPKTIYKLRRFIQSNKIDILINVESLLCVFSIPAIIGLSIRNICWEHFNFNIDLGVKSRRVARQLAALFCDEIITLTQRDNELWMKNTINRANILTISNPITIVDNHKYNENKKCNKIAIAVGRLTYQKGFDLLINAWSILQENRNDWVLKIIGSGEDEYKLKKLVCELGLTQSIIFLPTTGNIVDEYKNASLFILSSRFEGFGLVLLEAQFFGLPAISFNCEMGPSEIISNDSGWLCKPNDYKALSSCMLQAFNECDNDEVYENMSINAYENSQRFELSKIIEIWKVLLDKYE